MIPNWIANNPIFEIEIGDMKRGKNDIYLPNDVVIEILLRLPAKSLVQLKCVCRTWYNLIGNPKFVTDHLHHPRNPTHLFAYFCRHTASSTVSLFSDESLSVRQDIRKPISSIGFYIKSILGPVNGLYFMSYSDDESLFHQALWNPSTSEFRELPSLPSSQQILYQNKFSGFDSVGKDVKVISINTRLIQCHEDITPVIILYSLADDCWKNIEYDSAAFRHIVSIGQSSLHCNYNGAYYWLTKLTDRYILSLFDMKSEEFREVNFPPTSPLTYVDDMHVRDNSSIVLFVNSCVYSEDDLTVGCHVLWEMKEEGEWLKLMSFDHNSTYVKLDPEIYRFWKKDEIIINARGGKLLLYNINTHKTRNLEIDSLYEPIFLNYKESLTSVRGRGAST